MVLLPVDKPFKSHSDYDIYQLDEHRVGAQVTMFFDSGSDSNYCLSEFAENYHFKEVGPPKVLF